MNRLKQFFGDIKNKYQGLSHRRRVTLNASVGLVAAVLIGLIVWLTWPGTEEIVESKDPYNVTFTATEETEEMGQVNLIVLPGNMDLSVFFTDGDGNSIPGQSVKLVADSTEADEAATSLFEKALSLGEDEDDTELQSLYEDLYETMDGFIVTDEDEDGIIYVDTIDPGAYQVWFVPGQGYSTSSLVSTVNVEDDSKFKVVADIEKEVTAYDASEDVSHHNVESEDETSEKVEEETEDTSSYPKITSIASTSVYTPNEVVQEPAVGPTATINSAATNVLSGADGSTVVATASSSAVTLYPGTMGTMNVPLSISGVNVTGLAVKSSNSGVAAANYTGGNIVITAKNAGTANILITATETVTTTDEEGSAVTSQVTTPDTAAGIITVTVGSASTQLYDAYGRGLYKDTHAASPATVYDYNSNTPYYYCSPDGTTKYTGWQTINGVVYYFDADGNKLKGNYVIDGVVRYFDSETGALTETPQGGSTSSSAKGLCIDVSKFNGSINWAGVKSAGVKAAIIRCGGRYRTQRTLYQDPNFTANMKGAISAGIPVGIYIYSTATTEQEAIEEASLAVSMAGGYSVSLPIYIDMEDNIQGQLTTAQRTAIANAFCRTVQSAGYKAGIYASYNWWTTKLSASSLSSYYIWVARYNSTLGYSGKVNMWQYTSKGSVTGISGNVDLNYLY